MNKSVMAQLRKTCIAALAVLSASLFIVGCEEEDKDEVTFRNESSKTVVFNLGGYGDRSIEPGQSQSFGSTKKGSNVISETLYYYIESPSSVFADQTDSRNVVFRDK